ncbi:uncharacterized protein LOC100178092 [Ciona intestinalis]
MGGLISLITNVTDAVQYLSAITISFILGALTVVAVVMYLLHEYTKSIALPKKPKLFKKLSVGRLLHENLNSGGDEHSSETCRFLNMIIFFVFNEWRNSMDLHKWVLKKINVELMELMETKAASRFLQSLKIHDIELGSNLPIIHGVTMDDPKCQINGPLPDNVTIDIDIEYDGNLRLAVDVDLVFGKTAFVSLRIKYLKGSIRLQFSRFPCAHWSVCFVEEPDIKFDVDTSFETKQLPQLGSLIVNQIRRTIKKKHTFPHYKLRYNPVFSFQHVKHHSEEEVNEIHVNLTAVEVIIAACTRLLIPIKDGKDPNNQTVVFATLSLDEVSCENTPLLNEEKIERSFFGSPQKEKRDVSSEVKANGINLEPKKLFQTFTNGAASTSEKLSTTHEPLKASTSDLSGFKPIGVTTPKRKSNLKKVVPSTLSYLMVTRNFSATLHELPFTKSDGETVTAVHVKSLTENASIFRQTGIHTGDKILEINGNSISSLSQAVAVIESIRNKKERFRFKVQRVRSYSKMSNSSTVDLDSSYDRLHDKGSFLTEEMTNDSVHSDEDTESDYSDLDSEEYRELLKIEENVLKPKTPDLPPPVVEDLIRSPKTPGIDLSVKEVAPAPSTSSLRASFSTDRESNQEKLNFAKVTKTSVISKTTLCPTGTNEYTWKNEKFKLPVASEHKYLNIRFWFASKNQPMVNYSQPKLMGNLAIPLFELEMHCRLVTSQKFTRLYKISPPLKSLLEFRSRVNETFRHRSGFRLEYCFGDATIITKVEAPVL